MADVNEENNRRKRLARLKRELQSKAKRRRKQLLQAANIRKTSIDRSLEKSFLSKSEQSAYNSIIRRQMLLSLNLNLARQVQQLKESAKEMQNKAHTDNIKFCELSFRHNQLKQRNEASELEVERLKIKCVDYESIIKKKQSWKKSAEKKLREMFTMFNDSRVVSDRESVSLQDLDFFQSESVEPEKQLEDDVEDEIVNLESVSNKQPLQLGRTDFRTLFDMTSITEEASFTPNVTMDESRIDNLEVNHISVSDEEEDFNFEVLEEEVRKSRRDTFIVTKSLQIEALPTPVKSKNVRRSRCFNSRLENSDSSESDLPSNLSQAASANIDVNKTKLGAEDVEPTFALNKSAKKVIDQSSSKCVQNESLIQCFTNSIGCLTVASANTTLLPSSTPCSTNNSHDLNCYNQRPTLAFSEPRSSPCVQTKSPVPYVEKYNDSTECQSVASPKLTFPTLSHSTNNRNVDDRIQRQSVTAPICSNLGASSQTSSLGTDHSNRKSSLRKSKSVTNENTAIVKQVKLKKTNKLNKDGKLENEETKSKNQNTKLEKGNEFQQLQDKGTSALTDLNKTNFDAEDMELTVTLNNLIILGEPPAKKVSIDCLTLASAEPPFPTASENKDNANLDDLIHRQSVAASVSSNDEASNQGTSLIAEHSTCNRKSSLRRCKSVTSENTTVAKQIKKKRNNKQNKDRELDTEEAQSKSQNTKLKRQNQQLENEELSEESLALNKAIGQTSCSTQDSPNSIDCFIDASSNPTPLPHPSSEINSYDLSGDKHRPIVASSEPCALNKFSNLSCTTDNRNLDDSIHYPSVSVCSDNRAASSLATDYRNRKSSLKQSSSETTCETAIVVNKPKLKLTKRQNAEENQENEVINGPSQKNCNPKKSVKGTKSLSENLNLANVITMNATGNEESVRKTSQTKHSGDSSKSDYIVDDYLKTVGNEENNLRRPRRGGMITSYKEPSSKQKLRRN